MIEKNLKKFEPYLGIVVYKNESLNYLQVHSIGKSGEKYVWGEGKPFQREDLQELALSLRKEQLSTLKLKGMLPSNVLYFQPGIGGNKFMWYVEPQQFYLTFTPELKIRSGNYRFPGMVMGVIDDELYIYAIKGKDKPTEKTELYHAPFMNVYDDGTVCMGTITETRKKAYLHEEMDRWQRRFFGGRFTSAHAADEADRFKEYDLKKLYKEVFNATKFPEKALVPHKEYKTLDSLLKHFTKGGSNE